MLLDTEYIYINKINKIYLIRLLFRNYNKEKIYHYNAKYISKSIYLNNAIFRPFLEVKRPEKYILLKCEINFQIKIYKIS